jgi:eukaryotic-like serine/threonine-protein kinase
MMSEQSIFVAALERTDPADREAFLTETCAGDESLREHIERLLAFDRQDAGILERGPAPLLEARRPAALADGALFAGRFRLGQRLGEGGMGEVWDAEQTEPVQRRVALKVVRPGFDSGPLLARFEQERQALALMDHPNIARVLDAGVARDAPDGPGRPYFVMEFIEGVSITEYCDAARLSTRARLDLFVPVCQAVQHAHQKGVIHRDLKPSNILVGLCDGRPVPKVIDFGVAKATGPRLTEADVVTEVGSLIGTVEYMSPEQAELGNLDIDTRTDVYALGAVLYELLTGSVPFSRRELQAVALAEILRKIREDEPPRPSTRLSDSGALASVAAARHTEPKKLIALMRGELDWIVAKCLEKDRNRRYETASGLAVDLQRHLNDETVVARPPSAAYRLRKFLRRNRGPVLTVAAVFLAVALGGITATAGLVKAESARAAEAQRADGEREAKRLAERRLDQVRAGYALVGSIFADLDPKMDRAGDKPLRERLWPRLASVSRQLDQNAIGDPLTVAHLQTIVGRTLLAIGNDAAAADAFAKAHETIRRHFPADSDQVLEIRACLARAHFDAGQVTVSLPMEEDILRIRREKAGGETIDLLWSMRSLAGNYQASGRPDRAVRLLKEALQLAEQKLGPDERPTLHVMGTLASAYRETGRPDLAMPLTVRAYELSKARRGPTDSDTLTNGSDLADAYMLDGKHGPAIDLYEERLRIRRDQLDRDHPEVLANMNDLGLAYLEARKLDRAIPLFEDTLKLRRGRLPGADSRIQISINNLALAYQVDGQDERAIPLFEEALASYRNRPDANPASTWVMMNNLAASCQNTGRMDRAAALLEEAVAGIEGVKFQHRYADRIVRRACSVLELHQKRYGRAEALRRKWLAVLGERFGPASIESAEEQTNLGWNLVQQRQWPEAAALLRPALAVRREKQPDEWTTFNTQSILGEALLGLKQFEDAETHLVAGFDGMNRREAKIPGPAKVRLTQAADRLVRLYESLGRPAEAEKWRAAQAARNPTGK